MGICLEWLHNREMLLMMAMPMIDDPTLLLREVSNAYKAIITVKLMVNYQVSDANGRQIKGLAKVLYLRPNRLRAELDEKGKKHGEVRCDGKHIWSSIGRTTHTDIFEPDKLSNALPLNLETFCFFDAGHELSFASGGGMYGSQFKVTHEKWDSKEWTVLEERNTSDESFDKYYIDPETHLIWRVVDADLKVNRVYLDTQVKSLKTGEAIDEALFSLPKL